MTAATLNPSTTKPGQEVAGPPTAPEIFPDSDGDAIWFAAALDWDELDGVPQRSGFRHPIQSSTELSP